VSEFTVKEYSPADAVTISDNSMDPEFWQVNAALGPAYTLFEGRRPIFCGGVRFRVGEAWVLLNEEIRANPTERQKLNILRANRTKMDQIIRENGLYRLYAKNEKSARHLEALGFKKGEYFVWEAQ